MSRRKKPDPEDEEPRDIVPRPAPYPLDEALEEAYAPTPGNFTLPGHTDDDEYQEEEDSIPPRPPEASTAAKRYREALRTYEQTGTLESLHALHEARSALNAEQAATQPGSHPPETGATAAIGNLPPETGNSSPEATGDAAWVDATPPGSQVAPRAPVAQVPESLEDYLRRLKQWQQRYVLALMELGGNQAMACTRCKVSPESVEKHQASDPEFAAACAMAVKHSDGVLDAALFRGATHGDLHPIYQGGFLVGYKRVRDTRAAELLLRLRGRLNRHGTQEVTVKGSIHVSQASDEEMIGIMQRVQRELFDGRRGRPIIDIEAQNETIGDG